MFSIWNFYRPVMMDAALREHAERWLMAAASGIMDSYLLVVSGVSSCFSDAVVVKRR
jgi:hypothetical protein